MSNEEMLKKHKAEMSDIVKKLTVLAGKYIKLLGEDDGVYLFDCHYKEILADVKADMFEKGGIIIPVEEDEEKI
jgi:hypothetical protein